jgi:hypothetical protein
MTITARCVDAAERGARQRLGNRVSMQLLICESARPCPLVQRIAVAIGEPDEHEKRSAPKPIRRHGRAHPNDAEVTQFAASATLDGSADDDNASTWSSTESGGERGTIGRQIHQPDQSDDHAPLDWFYRE